MRKDEVLRTLRLHGQEQVAERMEKLEEKSQEKLVGQISKIDWDVTQSIKSRASVDEEARKVEPLKAVEL